MVLPKELFRVNIQYLFLTDISNFLRIFFILFIIIIIIIIIKYYYNQSAWCH